MKLQYCLTMIVIWVVAPCSKVEVNQISEVLAASIISTMSDD
jgi:hypothetical protein